MVSGATHSKRSKGFIEMSTASPAGAAPAGPEPAGAGVAALGCGSPFLKTRASYSIEATRSGSRRESAAPVGAPPAAS